MAAVLVLNVLSAVQSYGAVFCFHHHIPATKAVPCCRSRDGVNNELANGRRPGAVRTSSANVLVHEVQGLLLVATVVLYLQHLLVTIFTNLLSLGHSDSGHSMRQDDHRAAKMLSRSLGT